MRETFTFPEFKCRNCGQTIFKIITPGQVKFSLIACGVKFNGEHMTFTCPVCKEPQVRKRREVAGEMKLLLGQYDKYKLQVA